MPSLAFAPPSPSCRGLFYDGEAFWSAESIEDALGQIYLFDHGGNILRAWTEPAFQGWGACVVRSTDLESPAASSVSLDSIRPNPVDSSATFRFSLPAPSRVSLRIYSTAGRLVSDVASDCFAAGPHEILWDASEYASGVYFACLEAGGETVRRKVVVAR